MTTENQAGKIRKEVHLSDATINALQKQADREQRTLKNYMEYILIKQSQNNKK